MESAVRGMIFTCIGRGHGAPAIPATREDWEKMRRDLAYPDAPWTRARKGVFTCDADYYAKSGGILEPMPRYEKMYERLRHPSA